MSVSDAAAAEADGGDVTDDVTGQQSDKHHNYQHNVLPFYHAVIVPPLSRRPTMHRLRRGYSSFLAAATTATLLLRTGNVSMYR